MNPLDSKLLLALNTTTPQALFLKLTPSARHPREIPNFVQGLIEKVEASTGLKAQHHFRMTDEVLHVQAMPQFLLELLKSPDIAQAAVVPELGNAYIEPRNPRPIV